MSQRFKTFLLVMCLAFALSSSATRLVFAASSPGFIPGGLSVVTSVAELKALGPASSQYVAVNVTNYYSNGNGGGGLFFWSGTSTTAADDGIVIQPTGVRTGRWLRQFSGSAVEAQWFGAKCDNSFPDTKAIQAAINSAQTALLNGTVLLPAGNCLATLLITKPIRLRGAGMFSTFIHGNGLRKGDVVLNIDGTINPDLEGVDIEDLTLMSNNKIPDLLKINRVSNSLFRNIGCQNANDCLVITGNRTFSNEYDRIINVNGIAGSTVKFTAYNGGGQQTFTGGSFGGSTAFVISEDSTVFGISIVSCNFESSTVNAMYVGGNVYGLSLVAPRTENIGGSEDFQINPARGNIVAGLSITGGTFLTNRSSFAISLGGAGGKVRGFNIAGNYGLRYGISFVRLNGDGNSGIIIGNRLDKVPAAVDGLRAGVFAPNNETDNAALEPTLTPR